MLRLMASSYNCDEVCQGWGHPKTRARGMFDGVGSRECASLNRGLKNENQGTEKGIEVQ